MIPISLVVAPRLQSKPYLIRICVLYPVEENVLANTEKKVGLTSVCLSEDEVAPTCQAGPSGTTVLRAPLHYLD